MKTLLVLITLILLQPVNAYRGQTQYPWQFPDAIASTNEFISNEKPSLFASDDLPADRRATKETVNLYHNLKKLLKKGVMFGHQDDPAYGVGWKYEDGRSDVKDVTGDYPAVYGFELGRLELDHEVNLDSVPFNRMKTFIREAYDRGGVITISWHLNNPLTGKTAWDPAPGTVAAALPGGSKNDVYQVWLNNVADFMLSLRGKNGELIPVIFRPFHELNGNWFWWGKNNCTPEQLKQLYQFTESYLRDTKGVHNLLYAYNTDRFASADEYLERYPGDEWVDVLGFDIYQRNGGDSGNAQFISDIDKMLTSLEQIATESKKIPALTEFGYNGVPDNTWWTNVLWKGIQSHKISYALGWRNAGYYNGKPEFYVPYKDAPSAADFVKFYNEGKTFFQKDVAKEKLYK
jgi:hypothetical protein